MGNQQATYMTQPIDKEGQLSDWPPKKQKISMGRQYNGRCDSEKPKIRDPDPRYNTSKLSENR